MNQNMANYQKQISNIHHQNKRFIHSSLKIDFKNEVCLKKKLSGIIIKVYQEIYRENQKIFKDWISQRNSKNLSVLEMACQKSENRIPCLIFKYYLKYDIEISFLKGKNNIFHYIAKTDDIYTLVLIISIRFISMRKLSPSIST